MKEADDALKRNLRRAFQHILFLTQLSHDLPRQIDEITLEKDVETALDGTTVWKELAEKGKAFLSGQFTAKALLTNLTDTRLRQAAVRTARRLLPSTAAAPAARWGPRPQERHLRRRTRRRPSPRRR